jgi:hypothetical protein
MTYQLYDQRVDFQTEVFGNLKIDIRSATIP